MSWKGWFSRSFFFKNPVLKHMFYKRLHMNYMKKKTQPIKYIITFSLRLENNIRLVAITQQRINQSKKNTNMQLSMENIKPSWVDVRVNNIFLILTKSKLSKGTRFPIKMCTFTWYFLCLNMCNDEISSSHDAYFRFSWRHKR